MSGGWSFGVRPNFYVCKDTGWRQPWYFIRFGEWQIDWTRDDWVPLGVRVGRQHDDRHRVFGGYLRAHRYVR